MLKLSLTHVHVYLKCNLLYVKLAKFSRYYAHFALKGEHVEKVSSEKKLIHPYRKLFPWKDVQEFSETIVSSIIYIKDGLVALNKPYGIKIHSHDKPGTRSTSGQRFIIPSIKDCNYTIEDAIPVLQKHLNVQNLSILKSAERYTSGIVLLGTNDEVAAKVKKSLNISKLLKKLNFVHWIVTLGYPVVTYRKERVAIQMTQVEGCNFLQPVLKTEFSKRDSKLKRVHPVNVESRTLAINKMYGTSLIEMAISSGKFHFVRVYASSRMAPVLGDIMYGSRMKTLLGIPVKVQLQSITSHNVPSLPEQISRVLNLPNGETGFSMIPTLIHLQSVILPNFEKKDSDLIISAKPPEHFQWTIEKLNLYSI